MPVTRCSLFAIRNGRATFSGARSLSVATDAAGRAVATGGGGGLSPTALAVVGAAAAGGTLAAKKLTGGSGGSVAFTGDFSNTFPPSGNAPGGVNAYSYVFAGSLSGDQIVGTLRIIRTISNPGVPNAPPPATGSVTHSVTLR